jgi:hypothetical protein
MEALLLGEQMAVGLIICFMVLGRAAGGGQGALRGNRRVNEQVGRKFGI